MKIQVLVYLLLSLIACGKVSSDSPVKPALPELPIHHLSPFKSVTVHHEYTSEKSFETLLNTLNYNLETVRKTQQVPPVFATNIPHHLADLPTANKTSTFIRLLLPNILKVNKDLNIVRSEILQLQKNDESGKKLSTEEMAWLLSLSNEYGLSTTDFNEILKRVDTVPVAMVLAQGIDESGWGTSRFAIQGNAFYGQHLSSKGGKFIESASGNVKVAAFETIYHSTASYIHNLNATHAYSSFREQRENLRKRNKAITGTQMVEALTHYSERGQVYVDELKSIIRHYKLESYDDASLIESQPATRISFVGYRKD